MCVCALVCSRARASGQETVCGHRLTPVLSQVCALNFVRLICLFFIKPFKMYLIGSLSAVLSLNFCHFPAQSVFISVRLSAYSMFLRMSTSPRPWKAVSSLPGFREPLVLLNVSITLSYDTKVSASSSTHPC